MKKFIALSVVAAALALCVSSAKAVTVVGTTTDYEKINIAVTVVTNAPEEYNSKTETYTYKTGTASVNNKSLLAFFSSWTGITWPAGAQLIYDEDSDEVCVADKTGTNIYFYAGSDDGVDSGGVEAYFNYYPYDDGGAYSGSESEADTGSEHYTEWYYGYFEIYYSDGNDSDYLDLYGEGQNTDVYSESWKYSDTTDLYTYKWSDSESLKATGTGELKGNDASVTSISIGVSGSGTYTEP
jgi:hypothetical protein